MDERLKEIEARKLEILGLLKGEAEVDSDALDAEFKALETEEVEVRATIAEDARKSAEEETRKAEEAEEQRKLEVAKAEEEALAEKRKLAKEGKLEGKEIEEKEMTEKKFTVASPEYRSAWAKTMMGKPLTEEEQRAVGDATFTTAATFVAADSTHVGVNNGGLLIPTEVSTAILNIIEEQSPFFRDVRKLAVAGNVDLPYLYGADDAAWQTEGTDTLNEGVELRKIQLVGNELAKQVVVTWKLESMAVEDFISFITQELATKIAYALAKSVLYGDGSGECKGALYGLSATTGADVIAAVVAAYKALDQKFRIGAKAYISSDSGADLIGYQDDNGNYPFLMGIPAVSGLSVEVDPHLTSGDILVGNPANYVFNTVEPLSIARESHVAGRKTTYGAYMIADGEPIPGAFTKGGVTVVSA